MSRRWLPAARKSKHCRLERSTLFIGSRRGDLKTRGSLGDLGHLGRYAEITGKEIEGSTRAIPWVHGDGINQNYDGWHVQRNYAVYHSFHQYHRQSDRAHRLK